MSRVARNPITIPDGVEVSIANNIFKAKGKLGEMSVNINNLVVVSHNDNILTFNIGDVDKKEIRNSWMQAGTARSNINNCVIGVVTGFEKKLNLVGVGYKASIKGNNLELFLGFSHVINHQIPAGVKITTPSQTEIIVSGCDKQKIGQCAAEIVAYSPPEPYKGKGVCYAGKKVYRKEVNKK